MDPPTYTFFYRTANPFSNFHACTIVKGGHAFHSSEQMFMYGKAMLFGDVVHANDVLKASTPKDAKAIGRRVKPFEPKQWDEYKESLMKWVCCQKFTQNTKLKDKLMSTAGTTLVEASPYDTIWGIGMLESDPDVHDSSKWKGTNLLGKALTHIRSHLENPSVELAPAEHIQLFESWFQTNDPKKKIVKKK